MPFLGHVYQLEVGGERPDHVLGTLPVERVHDRDHPPPPGSRGPLPEADRGLPEALDVTEQVGSAVRGDGVAEQRREQADVPPQRIG